MLVNIPSKKPTYSAIVVASLGSVKFIILKNVSFSKIKSCKTATAVDVQLCVRVPARLTRTK